MIAVHMVVMVEDHDDSGNPMTEQFFRVLTEKYRARLTYAPAFWQKDKDPVLTIEFDRKAATR